MRSLLFFAIPTLFPLTDLLFWWWADRRLRRTPHAPLWRTLLGVFVGGQLLVLIWIIALGRRHSGEVLPMPITAAAYIWHLFIVPFVMAGLLLGTAGYLGYRLVNRHQSHRQPASDGGAGQLVPCDPPDAVLGESADADRAGAGMTRRQLLGAAIAAAPPVIALAATGRAVSQLRGFRVLPIVVPLPQLPPELDGMTIAQVADVHVGPFTHGPILKEIVEATNRLRADLVLLTGDLINGSLSDLPAGLDMVKRLDPHYGLAMCEGNHDLFEGREAFDRQVKASGVPLLIDESMMVRVRGRLVQLLGLQWGRGGFGGGGERVIEPSMKKLVRQLRPDAFPILLAHHPHAFDPAADAGIPLTLSGHTHGGQIMLTRNIGFGPEMFRYWSGLYQKPGAALVVSNGVGNWFPLRINAPAEIVYITLMRNQVV